MRTYLPTVAKAVGAGVVAGLGAGVTAAVDDAISTGEWWAIASAAAAGAYAVWRIPNATEEDEGATAP